MDAGLLELQLDPLDRALAEAMPGLRALFRESPASTTRRSNASDTALDFDDLEQGALALLQDGHRGAAALAGGDPAPSWWTSSRTPTSASGTWSACLNGGRGKLFIVGDAKQSIYRFRGADVTVFRAGARADRDGRRPSLLPGHLLPRPPGADPGLERLAPAGAGGGAGSGPAVGRAFRPPAPHREAARPGLEAPYIELHLTVGSKSGGALDRAADALVGRIVELVEGVLAAADGRSPAAGLWRRGHPLPGLAPRSAYEDALERAGVPFLTVAGRGFYGRPEIRDLLNALQALADPTDDLALAGLLRSPAFALSDAALFHLGDRWREAGRSGIALGACCKREPADPVSDDRRKADGLSPSSPICTARQEEPPSPTC